MSTWLDHWDRRYIDRVRLLVEILPVLAQEPRFALKGGTAINLFEHDLPRLSVDIGFAEVQVLDFADLYAGKLAAALSRQHPRDLFDVGLLLQDERADEALWRTFLVYLTCSPKPAWEMLAPRVPADFEATFEAHFKGMTTEPVEMAALLESHERLLSRMATWLDEPSRAFLQSVEDERPDFSLIGLAPAADLPGVRRKLHNLAQRTAAKRAADRGHLAGALARIAAC